MDQFMVDDYMVDKLNQTISPNPCVHKNFFKQKNRNHMQYK